jgi:hypothetical protein
MARGDGQQSDVSGPLDRFGNFTLMFRAIAGNSPGNDLSPFRNERTESSRILVVDLYLLVSTETAYLSALKSSFFPAAISPCGCSFVTHICNPPLFYSVVEVASAVSGAAS